jgi:hypothetical protein
MSNFCLINDLFIWMRALGSENIIIDFETQYQHYLQICQLTNANRYFVISMVLQWGGINIYLSISLDASPHGLFWLEQAETSFDSLKGSPYFGRQKIESWIVGMASA